MIKPRLIAFDLDGTALTERKILTPRTREVFQRAAAQGILLLPTTGRALAGIPDAVKVLDGARYALTSNGAGVYRRLENRLEALPAGAREGKPTFELDTDNAYELLFENLMNHERTLALMEELLQLNVMPDPFIEGRCYISADKTFLIDKMDVSDAMKDYIHSSRTKTADMLGFLADKEIQKITINFACDETGERIDLEPVLGILKRYPEYVAVTGGIRNIEITDRLATKGASMLRLAESLGIKAEEIVAFGDSENDNSMLEAAGTGVAMANALDITKAVADTLTLSNDDEGVAAFLENTLGI